MGSGIYHHHPPYLSDISKRRQTSSRGVIGIYNFSVLLYLLRIPACLLQALLLTHSLGAQTWLRPPIALEELSGFCWNCWRILEEYITNCFYHVVMDFTATLMNKELCRTAYSEYYPFIHYARPVRHFEAPQAIL